MSLETFLIFAGLTWVGFAVGCLAIESFAKRKESQALRIVALAAWRVGRSLNPMDADTRHRETVIRAVQLGRIEGLDIATMLGGQIALDAAAWWAINTGEER